jgi:hypothetical protein
MAIKKIQVPFCDVCGEPWLPKHRSTDGTVNPLFEKPEKSKRCGKCKSTRWNAAGVDRRRKAVVESPVEAFIAADADTTQEEIETACAEIPQVTVQDVEQTIDAMPMPVIPREVFQYAKQLKSEFQAISGRTNVRCKHGLYSCPECHHQEAA